jgi:hypothetical protein
VVGSANVREFFVLMMPLIFVKPFTDVCWTKAKLVEKSSHPDTERIAKVVRLLLVQCGCFHLQRIASVSC